MILFPSLIILGTSASYRFTGNKKVTCACKILILFHKFHMLNTQVTTLFCAQRYKQDIIYGNILCTQDFNENLSGLRGLCRCVFKSVLTFFSMVQHHFMSWFDNTTIILLLLSVVLPEVAAYHWCFYQSHINIFFQAKSNTMQLCTFCVARILSDTLVLIIISNVIFLCECFLSWHSEEFVICVNICLNDSGLADFKEIKTSTCKTATLSSITINQLKPPG